MTLFWVPIPSLVNNLKQTEETRVLFVGASRAESSLSVGPAFAALARALALAGRLCQIGVQMKKCCPSRDWQSRRFRRSISGLKISCEQKRG